MSPSPLLLAKVLAKKQRARKAPVLGQVISGRSSRTRSKTRVTTTPGRIQREGAAVSEISQLRRHLEALQRARDFMMTEIDAGTTHYVNHNTVSRLDTIIQELMIEVDMSEEEA